MNANDIIRLVRLSVAEPEKGAAAVIALNPPIAARWMLVAVSVLVGVVAAYLLPLMAGRLSEMPSPLTATTLQVGANVLAIALITVVGRIFGGTGRFEDAVLLVGWLQLIMVVVQIAQLVFMLVLPPLAGLVMVGAVVLFFWLLAGFVRGLHGFRSRFTVLMGVFASLFAAAFVVTFVLLLLGIELPGMTDV